MKIVFRFAVSDLVLRTELVQTGMHGPRERTRKLHLLKISETSRATLAAFGIDSTLRPHHTTHADLVTFRAVSTPWGTRIERRLIQVNQASLSPLEIDGAIAGMAESRRQAQAIAARNARTLAASARRHPLRAFG